MKPSRDEIKKKMALPPIQHPANKDRKDRNRDRNRVRLELDPISAEMISQMLEEKLAGMSVDEPGFRPVFKVFNNIMDQTRKLGGVKNVS